MLHVSVVSCVVLVQPTFFNGEVQPSPGSVESSSSTSSLASITWKSQKIRDGGGGIYAGYARIQHDGPTMKEAKEAR